MRNLTILFAVLFAATLYNPPAGLAQSSGSFSASFGTTQCSIAPNDGTLSGGISGNSLPDLSIMASRTLFSRDMAHTSIGIVHPLCSRGMRWVSRTGVP
jgi:hypothetical protein